MDGGLKRKIQSSTEVKGRFLASSVTESRGRRLRSAGMVRISTANEWIAWDAMSAAFASGEEAPSISIAFAAFTPDAVEGGTEAALNLCRGASAKETAGERLDALDF